MSPSVNKVIFIIIIIVIIIIIIIIINKLCDKLNEAQKHVIDLF